VNYYITRMLDVVTLSLFKLFPTSYFTRSNIVGGKKLLRKMTLSWSDSLCTVMLALRDVSIKSLFVDLCMPLSLVPIFKILQYAHTDFTSPVTGFALRRRRRKTRHGGKGTKEIQLRSENVRVR